MKKIFIYMNKGGVGKSTITALTALTFSKLGYRTLILDLDTQNNVFGYLGGNKREIEYYFDDCLDKTTDISINDCIYSLGDNIDIVVSKDMEIIQKEIFHSPRIDTVIKNAMKDLKNKYDFVLFDAGSEKTELKTAVFLYIDYLLIPCETSYAGVKAVPDTLSYLIKLDMDIEKVLPIIPNRLDVRINEHKEALETLKEFIKQFNKNNNVNIKITEPIRTRNSISRCFHENENLFERDPDTAEMVIKSLRKVVKEIASK
jgi:chromosome partitioning protein